MKIQRVMSQWRRDYTAIYECEHCGHNVQGAGYDDQYFHEQVIPNMSCPDCGQTASDDYRTPLEAAANNHGCACARAVDEHLGGKPELVEIFVAFVLRMAREGDPMGPALKAARLLMEIDK